MSESRIDGLVEQLRAGNLSRRQFTTKAIAMGLSVGAAAAIAQTASAQDAAAGDFPTGDISPTREEYYASLREAFEFEEPASQGGLAILGFTSDIDSLVATLGDDSPTLYIIGLMFEALIGASPVDGTLVPGLADSWSLAEDGMTYTFNINPNAMWHDGQPVTAEDCVFSFDAILGEGSLSAYASTVANVLESYRAVDEKTFEMKAKDVFATFLYDAPLLAYIVPKHIWEGVPLEQWGSDPGNTGQDPARVVGSGPFRFVEWVQGDNVRLAKNEAYWDPESIPAIDEFVMQVIPEESAALQALIAGEIDLYERVPPSQYETIRNSEGIVAYDYSTFDFNWYSPNQDPAKNTLFTEIPVRQAMLYALDRDLILEAIYLSIGVPAQGTQPELSIAYRPDEINTVYTYDPDRARQLLEEAGWVDSDGDGIREKDGQRFSFECLFSEGSAIYEQQLPYMQQAWREVGIEMIPAAVPFPTLQEATDTGNFQMAVYGFSWGLDGGQAIMFSCDSFSPNGFNSMRYCNPRYDELEQQQLRELDPEKRVALLVEQSNIVNDEAANGIIVFRGQIDAHNARVHNRYTNGYGFIWSIPFIWIEQ